MEATFTNQNYLDTLVSQVDEAVVTHGRKHMRDEGIWDAVSSDHLWNLMNATDDAKEVATALKYIWAASPNGYLIAGHLLDNYDDHPHDEAWIDEVYKSVDFPGYIKRYP